jgi:hypothetical protein
MNKLWNLVSLSSYAAASSVVQTSWDAAGVKTVEACLAACLPGWRPEVMANNLNIHRLTHERQHTLISRQPRKPPSAAAPCVCPGCSPPLFFSASPPGGPPPLALVNTTHPPPPPSQVPAWVTKRWLHTLSREFPTLAFHASVTNPFGKGAPPPAQHPPPPATRPHSAAPTPQPA